MYLNHIVVESFSSEDEIFSDVLEGVMFLCGTPEGRYPMNREFGIDVGLADHPLPVAKQLLAIEYKEKIERFEPRVEVMDVEFSYDEENMCLTPHIVLSPSEDWEEDTDEEYEEQEEDEDDV